MVNFEKAEKVLVSVLQMLTVILIFFLQSSCFVSEISIGEIVKASKRKVLEKQNASGCSQN